jgi:K+-sensing histidine kinase KdpD
MDVLDVAKAEEGALRLQREPVDLQDLLGELRTRFLRTAATYQVTLAVNAEPDLLACADRGLVVRVLENLIENGLRYAGAGGRLELSATEQADGVVLTVANTGATIPEATRSQLFQKYGSTQDPMRSANRGLGLYFCRLVAEAHGGSVRALPRASGAAIEVRLPAHKESIGCSPVRGLGARLPERPSLSSPP